MIVVKLAASLRDVTDGADEIRIDAGTIRELIRKLVERYPKLQGRVDQQEIAVSVNGEIFRDERNVAIPDGAEVYLLPRIQGG